MNDKKKIENNKTTHFKSKNKRDIRLEILKILKDDEYGLNVSQLAEKLGVTRNTIRNHLASLEQEQLITVKQVGQSKIIFRVNRNLEDVFKNIQTLISNFLTGFWKGFEKVMYPIHPDSHELLEEMGREMSRNVFWPTIKSERLVKKIATKKKLLEEVGKFALQIFEVFNLYGEVPMLIPEISPSRDPNVLIIRVEYTGGFRVGDTDAFYYLLAGFFEENLNRYTKQDLYIKVLKIQKEKSCCYYELGIKNNE
ncbi:MAG: ArsR/SmtB family transcription factor [Candidatus Helarchaeota archaeon]